MWPSDDITCIIKAPDLSTGYVPYCKYISDKFVKVSSDTVMNIEWWICLASSVLWCENNDDFIDFEKTLLHCTYVYKECNVSEAQEVLLYYPSPVVMGREARELSCQIFSGDCKQGKDMNAKFKKESIT